MPNFFYPVFKPPWVSSSTSSRIQWHEENFLPPIHSLMQSGVPGAGRIEMGRLEMEGGGGRFGENLGYWLHTKLPFAGKEEERTRETPKLLNFSFINHVFAINRRHFIIVEENKNL